MTERGPIRRTSTSTPHPKRTSTSTPHPREDSEQMTERGPIRRTSTSTPHPSEDSERMTERGPIRRTSTSTPHPNEDRERMAERGPIRRTSTSTPHPNEVRERRANGRTRPVSAAHAASERGSRVYERTRALPSSAPLPCAGHKRMADRGPSRRLRRIRAKVAGKRPYMVCFVVCAAAERG